MKAITEERLAEAQCVGLKLSVDLSLSDSMSDKMDITDESFLDLFPPESVVCLTPDAEEGGQQVPPLPVSEMLTNEHSIPPITFWLMQFLRKLSQYTKIKVHQVETDYSWALLQSVLLSFNKESIVSYLDRAFAICSKLKSWKEIRMLTVLHICSAHVLKAVAQSIGRKTADKGLKEFATFAFARLQNATSMTTALKIFRSLCTVLIGKHNSNTVLIHLKAMKDFIKECRIPDMEEGNKLGVSPLTQEEDDEERRNAHTIVGRSPFTYEFRKVMEEVQGELENEEVETHRMKIHTFALAFGLLLGNLKRYATDTEEDTFGQSKTRDTNCHVERWFGIVKHSILKKQRRLRPATYIRKMYGSLQGRYREHIMAHHLSEQLLLKTLLPRDISQSKEGWAKRDGVKPRTASSKYYTTPDILPVPKRAKLTVNTGEDIQSSTDVKNSSNDPTSKGSKPATEVLFFYIKIGILNLKDNAGRLYHLDHYTMGVILHGTREQMARQELKKYFKMRRNRLGKEDWINIKWQPGKITHTFQKDATSCGAFVMQVIQCKLLCSLIITHFILKGNSNTRHNVMLFLPSVQLAKMTVKEFPKIPQTFHINSSKQSLQNLRRDMAEEILKGSGKMDEFKHPLFFEAKDLTDKEKDKVRRHFQKRRDSGGGDCGMIEKAGGNMYTICFKEIEDQERVLQRKFHSISLPSGDLCLNTTTKVNTKGLEKMFKLDIFLMYFLRDNLKAYKLLQKQLSCIGSQVELDFEEEEAVVRGDIEKGPGGAFGASEQWELQVDRVLINFTENYLCYHVVEPKKAKILLQDLSFVTDDIKVYREGGYPVVVGETEAVREKIAILEKSLPTRKELPMVEKLFKLVEEEFSREMLAKYPEVKINIGSAMVTLEGPDKEVQSGANTLEDLKQKVKEKRVKLSTALMTFLGSSGAVSKYQTRFQQRLRNPVSLEVGSEVVMSSLSSDALDEAEATLQRDFDVANVELQEALAAPPDLDGLKEILFKAKNEANSREFRVDVSFIPGTGGTPNTKVRLVGYRENVNKLKEVLHDYQINQIWTQEVLNLPNPDLLDCFDKILGMIGMKQSKVTLKASLYPYPCVLVSGPCRLVNEAKQGLISAIASLTSDTLVLDGPGALQYFQAEGKVGKELVESSFQVIVKEQQGVHSANVQSKPQSISSPLTSGLANGPLPRLRCNTVGSNVAIKTSLEIKLGSLIDAQANVMVVPMLNKNLTSTKIGKHLFQKAGNAIKSKFDSVAANCTVAPGDVLQVAAPPTLGCSRLFFIECLPWDGVRGQSVKALGNGLKRCLDLCVQQGYSTVAFPVIGPGVVLKYPMKEAIQLLMENICQLGLSASSGSLTTIQIVIKPGYPDSEECYQDVYRHPGLNVNQGGQAIFRALTSDLDEITMTVGGGVKLQLVFAKYTRGDVFVSQSGEFPCEALFHVCGQKDAVVIEQLVIRIVEHCESFRFESVAIPAISAGAGGLDPCVVARAVLRGVKDATSSFGLNSLTDIRLVLLKSNVFLAFKEEAMQMFSTAVIYQHRNLPLCSSGFSLIVNISYLALQFLYLSCLMYNNNKHPSSVEADLSIVCNSSTSQQSVFRFLGLSRKDVDGAMTKLTDLYQAQCYSQTFRKEELKDLTQDDVKDLKQLVETEGLYVELSQGTFKVSGLNNGVNKVMQMINASLHGNLRREVRVREEEDLYARVAWCILGHRGNWERLPKTANHSLENNDVGGRIVDAQGNKWTMDLPRMEATKYLGGQTTKLKRLEHLDFTLPLYWDNMAAGEALKTVELLPSYAEYRTVKEAFKRTVGKTVLKIERLQNVHLRRAYEAQKKQISDKYKQQGGECEKLLYHGTTQDNCESIVKTGFNRRFSGQNAADGSQLMFVARVLTGIYTQGQQNMRVPPPVSNQGGDRYDSVVDRVDNPQMWSASTSPPSL
ncbi:hypothetical protein F7725_004658 [Dissostichus mawsoni]|uniref:Poly [ADP-ribose] polymerase n=1 Tax=Dissostichus mawsoni TaxID=36200 RepID=A0A7J5XJE9_DISMA|nr:hypothetical protein F7725_004658 [Dissostichus mawsoni]